ncbi:MAG: hypothetical protein KF850_05410 [Labilithrix sp.]|nr:hypothetical protein [Labilithrix sp.]MBX3211449.1 hypothetical protein [Labilithrix sp.]
MAEREAAVVSSSSPAPPGRTPFDRAKRHLVLACAAIAGGLAIAGSVDRSTGGVLVLLGWLGGIVALHRLGRTGSDRGAAAGPAAASKARAGRRR